MKFAAVAAASCAVLSEARVLRGKSGFELELTTVPPPPARVHSPRWGSASCPCIGISGVNGEFTVNIMNHSNGDYDTTAQYPAAVGSYCHAWDDGRDPIHCQEGQEPGQGNDWCGQAWCFVDACNCEGISSPPKVTSMLPQVIYEGRILYYSYATCGAEDRWTVDNNAKACIVAENEEDCMDQADGNCVWGETTWGTKCLGWEAGGLCTDLPKQSEWGEHDCPCIGFSGVEGTMHLEIDGDNVDYPGELGSTCKPWHMDHLPVCIGDDKADFCGEPWCFVDIDRCSSVKPRPSTYLPDAMWNGHKLYYSYETCGGKAPLTTTTMIKTTTASEEDDEEPEDEDEAAEEQEEQQADEDEEKLDQEESKLDDEMDDSTGPGFDHKAYNKEWHQEWRQGSIPAMRDQYPQIKKYQDRQSDGKASKVPSGQR